MYVFKISNYNDVKSINNYLNSDFIVDLKNCNIPLKRGVVDFLSWLLYLNGKLEKKNKNQFIVKGC